MKEKTINQEKHLSMRQKQLGLLFKVCPTLSWQVWPSVSCDQPTVINLDLCLSPISPPRVAQPISTNLNQSLSSQGCSRQPTGPTSCCQHEGACMGWGACNLSSEVGWGKKNKDYSDAWRCLSLRWADQCTNSHDYAKQTLDGVYVGQNLYMVSKIYR